MIALLTDKDVQPSSSFQLHKSRAIQELKWLNRASRDYIVLSNDGILSSGCVGKGPVPEMENVDAVDCCKSGSYIAASIRKSLKILSSDFEEECCITLFSQLWSNENDSEAVRIKVDFIGWVRDDSIVVGCTQLNEDGNGEGYLVQVIRSDKDTFFESSSKPVILLYVDFSRAVMDDVLPSGVGCGLLLGYLNHWDLILAFNKRMTKEPISLFKWPSITGHTKTVVYLEILEKKYSPKIEQVGTSESKDINAILGFWVEKVTLLQNISGAWMKEIPPQHILLCLNGEGKLIIYNLERSTDPSDLPEIIRSTIQNSNDSLSEHVAEPSSAQADQGNYNHKETSYLGIQNQGATCYMSVALQFLCHIPYFRKSVYKMCAVENDMQPTSIPFALQSIFYKLKYSHSKVTTTELTESLGLSKEYVLVHQDVEEHILSFLDKLRDSMKGTCGENIVDKLFKGHYVSYIKCVSVGDESVTVEPFYDLQLDVAGCRDLYASFDKFVEVARLEGDNKYASDKSGLQDAEKNVLFKDLPPVLQLHLKRFAYDATIDTSVKINDYYEFPLQLDLGIYDGKYLSPDADRERKYVYTLHRVKFDDEHVSNVDMKTAVQEQYGVDGVRCNSDEFLICCHKNNKLINILLQTTPFMCEHPTAYVLIYIRESDKDELFCQVDEKDLAKHLQIRLEKDCKEKEPSKKEKVDAHLCTRNKIAGDNELEFQEASARKESCSVERAAASIVNQSFPTRGAVLANVKAVTSGTHEPLLLTYGVGVPPIKKPSDAYQPRLFGLKKGPLKLWLKYRLQTDVLIGLVLFYSSFYILLYSTEVGVQIGLGKEEKSKLLVILLEELSWLMVLATYLGLLRWQRGRFRRKKGRVRVNAYLPHRIQKEEDCDSCLVAVHGISRLSFAVCKEGTLDRLGIPLGLLVTHLVSVLVECLGSYGVMLWYNIICLPDGVGEQTWTAL